MTENDHDHHNRHLLTPAASVLKSERERPAFGRGPRDDVAADVPDVADVTEAKFKFFEYVAKAKGRAKVKHMPCVSLNRGSDRLRSVRE